MGGSKENIFSQTGIWEYCNMIDFNRLFQNMNKKLSKDLDKIRKYEAEKSAQPFLTNQILEDLIHSQTPKWVNYSILIIASLTLIITVIALLHSL